LTFVCVLSKRLRAVFPHARRLRILASGLRRRGHGIGCFRKSGTVKAGRQGNPGRSKLDAHADFIFGLIEARKDIALHEIVQRLTEEHGVTVRASTVWYFLDRRGITFKKRQRMLPNKTVRTSPPPAKSGSKDNPILIRPA
jgi:transposase